MPLPKTVDLEPIPGYRLLAPLGQGGFGDVWKCEAPGGFLKAIKFVASTLSESGNGHGNAVQLELLALERIKTLRHPFLLQTDRVQLIDGELVIVMELADSTLQDVFDNYRRQGFAGIPRDELLGYLRETAEVLDLLNQNYSLVHLDIKPRNLFLVHRHVKVADFGLVSGLSELSGSKPLAQPEHCTPLYAAPEKFHGKVTIHSDQYSLAVVYVELLTGSRPFEGKTLAALAVQHLTNEPNLAALPASDRAAVSRALAKEPHERWPSCLDLVRALQGQPDNGKLVDRATGVACRAGLAIGEDQPVADLSERDQVFSDKASAGRAPLYAGIDLPGYQFLECVSRHPLGEVWRTRTTDGRSRLVKFVFGIDLETSADTAAGLARLRGLRRRGLLPTDFLEAAPGRLVVVTDAGDTNLAELLEDYQRAGQQGVPRAKLIDYLGEAAFVLDSLRQTHGLQHLSLAPRELVLVKDRLHVTGFGLVELLWRPAGHQPAALNSRYAAPELFDSQVSPACDQYSLALIYAELLTSRHPFGDQHSRRRGKLDLELLPAWDLPIILRALHSDPDQRYHSAGEFIETLERANQGGAGSKATADSHLPTRADDPPEQAAAVPVGLTPATLPMLSKMIRELHEEAPRPVMLEGFGLEHRPLLTSPNTALAPLAIRHRCFACLLSSTLRVRLDAFRKAWEAQRVSAEGDRYFYQVFVEGSPWQRWLGKLPGLEIDIRCQLPDPGAMALTCVEVTLRPIYCDAEQGARLLQELGPPLLESLRKFLQACPERRQHERVALSQVVKVHPILANQQLGNVIVASTRDLSQGGIGLCLPVKPASRQLCIELASPRDPAKALVVQGQIVRCTPGQNGFLDAGVAFLVAQE